MFNWQTFGHNHIKKVLEFQLQNNSLAHAYLFVGPKGVGKSGLAQEFALAMAPISANRMYFNMAESGKMADMREILHLSSLTSTDGGRKVVILDGFEEAGIPVANALLKTLEEPSSHTVFVLVSSGGNLLSTIVSRCAVMRFGSLSSYEMADFARQRDWQPTSNEYEYAAGVPGRLMRLLSGEEGSKVSLAEVVKINEASRQSDAQKLILASDLSEHDPGQLMDILEAWSAHLTSNLSETPQHFSAVKVAQETIRRLKMNANKKMAIEFFTLNTKL